MTEDILHNQYPENDSQPSATDGIESSPLVSPASGAGKFNFPGDLRAYSQALHSYITNDLLRSAGFGDSGFKRKIMQSLLYLPGKRFSNGAVSFDYDVATLGFQKAIYNLMYRFVCGYQISGRENIPTEGPLLMVANHPGTIDGMAVIANTPREDLKVTIVGDPFVRHLVASSKYLICIPRIGDHYGRMEAMRSIIRHLKDGGALLMFPTGKIDPDPSVLPGSEDALRNWSPSLELILRKVPQTRLLVTIISGVISPTAVNHPLTTLLNRWEKAKVAGVTQILLQIFFPNKYRLTPQITFGPALTLDEIKNITQMAEDGQPEVVLSTIIDQARQLLIEHRSALNLVFAPLEHNDLQIP